MIILPKFFRLRTALPPRCRNVPQHVISQDSHRAQQRRLVTKHSAAADAVPEELYMHVYAALLVRNPPDGPRGGGASASRPVVFVQISDGICGVMEDCDIDLSLPGLAVASHMLLCAQGGRLCCGMLCHLLDVPIMPRSSTTHTDRPYQIASSAVFILFIARPKLQEALRRRQRQRSKSSEKFIKAEHEPAHDSWAPTRAAAQFLLRSFFLSFFFTLFSPFFSLLPPRFIVNLRASYSHSQLPCTSHLRDARGRRKNSPPRVRETAAFLK